MSYKINTEEPDKVKSIKLGLRNNVVKYGKPYCPCSLRRDETTVCPCQEFRLHPEMKKCHCGLYIREDEE